MATAETSFTVRKRKPRTREGSASVITSELLEAIKAEVEALEDSDGIVVLDSHPRNTPGSAAGFGYQVKEKLAKMGLKVHSSPVPVDEDAWEALSDEDRSPAGLKAIKDGTDAVKKDAIKHYPAFYRFTEK